MFNYTQGGILILIFDLLNKLKDSVFSITCGPMKICNLTSDMFRPLYYDDLEKPPYAVIYRNGNITLDLSNIDKFNRVKNSDSEVYHSYGILISVEKKD